MVVVDTSAWIEWLVDSPAAAALLPHWPAREICLVPTLVQLELVKWLIREQGEDAADEMLAFTQTCAVAPLDTRVARLAAELCGRHGLATADSIIYATAIEHGAGLLTCDRHFKGLDGVLYVPNKP